MELTKRARTREATRQGNSSGCLVPPLLVVPRAHGHLMSGPRTRTSLPRRREPGLLAHGVGGDPPGCAPMGPAEVCPRPHPWGSMKIRPRPHPCGRRQPVPRPQRWRSAEIRYAPIRRRSGSRPHPWGPVALVPRPRLAQRPVRRHEGKRRTSPAVQLWCERRGGWGVGRGQGGGG
jgi:hypothetical protein